AQSSTPSASRSQPPCSTICACACRGRGGPTKSLVSVGASATTSSTCAISPSTGAAATTGGPRRETDQCLPSYMASYDELDLSFIHEQHDGDQSVPLLMLHGVAELVLGVQPPDPAARCRLREGRSALAAGLRVFVPRRPTSVWAGGVCRSARGADDGRRPDEEREPLTKATWAPS